MFSWLVGLAFVGQVPPPKLDPEIEDRVRSATVRVRNGTQQTVANGVVIGHNITGTGFYVLTVAHLFSKGDKLVVDFFPTGPGGAHTAAVEDVPLRSDPFAEDLAVVFVSAGKKLDVATLRLPAPPPVKQAFKAFGAFSFSCPQMGPAESQHEHVVDCKAIAKKQANKKTQFWIIQDVPDLGRSGGPLIDAQGQFLGLCSGNDGKVGYYTHSDEIRRFLTSNRIIRRILDD